MAIKQTLAELGVDDQTLSTKEQLDQDEFFVIEQGVIYQHVCRV